MIIPLSEIQSTDTTDVLEFAYVQIRAKSLKVEEIIVTDQNLIIHESNNSHDGDLHPDND